MRRAGQGGAGPGSQLGQLPAGWAAQHVIQIAAQSGHGLNLRQPHFMTAKLSSTCLLSPCPVWPPHTQCVCLPCVCVWRLTVIYLFNHPYSQLPVALLLLTVAAANVKRKFSHLCAASRICILISLEQVATVSSTRLEPSTASG